MLATLNSRLLDRLPGVGLEAVVAEADLQVRTDRKYLVPHDAVDDLLQACGADLRALTIQGLRVFRYESVYFDTPDLVSYLQAARRRPRRFKVRTRTYHDTGTSAVEVKVRDARGRTIKHRQPHPIDHRQRLTPSGRSFVGSYQQPASHLSHLTPTLATHYHRSTLMLMPTGDRAVRITIDVGLSFEDLAGGRHARLDHVALIETKTAGHASDVDRALWRMGHRPKRISKYCTGLAALRPTLPAHKWNRTLRHYFGWRPEAAPRSP